ncbi:hypothetical protein BX666DRAFT_2027860 [Dichotomocladium elegans]|nr:hypothetical protein BX666DRAFT_2027860 [Dichotomocladium elegans]
MSLSYADSIEFIHEGLEKLSNAEVIAWATCALENLVLRQLEILKIRASQLAKQFKYEQALTDCESMIEIAPTVGDVYLFHGSLCVLQGYQKEAIRTYNRGLRYVELLPAREALLAAKAEALSKMATKIDFIATLPPEIASNIIQRVIPEWIPDEYGCAVFRVSKTWRSRFLDLSHSLGVTTETTVGAYQDEKNKDLVVAAVPCATRLIFQSPSRKVLAEMEASRLYRLHSLCLTDVVIQDIELFKSALSSVGHTLTSLWMGAQRKNPILLGTALSVCPKLEIFVGTGSSLQIQNSQDRICSGHFPQLKELYITLYETDDYDPEPILKACPSLEYLHIIGPTATAKNLRLLHNYGDKLISAGLDVVSPPYNIHSLGSLMRETKEPGLQDLSLGCLPESGMPDLVKLLKRHRHSLKDLFIDLDEGEPSRNQDYFLIFGRVEMLYKLTSLTVEVSGAVINEQAISSLIQHAPALEMVCLRLVETVTVNLLESITALDHLRCIRLEECGSIDNEGLSNLFEKHVDLGEESPLREVTLDTTMADSSLIEEETFMLLAEIKTLTVLKLAGEQNLPKKALRRILMYLSKNAQRLAEVSFTSIPAIDDAAIRYISQSKSLESLHLKNMTNLTGAFLIHFARIHRLTSLKVEDCPNVDWNTLNLAYYCLYESCGGVHMHRSTQ